VNIPKGYKLVPVEPTEEMIYAIATGAHRGDSGKEIWSEALAYAADIDWPKIAIEAGLQYVHEPDDHYVTATPEKMADLLRDVIGIDIRRPSGCGYNESKRPQPIYDEAKERDRFDAEYDKICCRTGITIREIAWRIWQARAKAGEVL